MISDYPDKDQVEEEGIPEILGSRCVHNHIELATCRACVDACPLDAWILNDEMLGIDSQRCDGCGLCAPVCPEGAIQHDYAPLVGAWKDRSVAMNACEKANTSVMPEAEIPCIHVLGLHNLLSLHNNGCTAFITTTGDCSTCERGQNPSLQDTVAAMNTLLKQRGHKPVSHAALTPEKWEALVYNIKPDSGEEAVSRRDFIREMLGQIGEYSLDVAGLRETEEDEYIPTGRLLPPSLTPTDYPGFPSVPVIHEQQCTACHACVRVCPHDAVNLMTDEETGITAYVMDVANCTGCGLCIDVCEHEAVSIHENTRPEVEIVVLDSRQCTACGAEFYYPYSREEETGQLCRICEKTNHSKNLFQVY